MFSSHTSASTVVSRSRALVRKPRHFDCRAVVTEQYSCVKHFRAFQQDVVKTAPMARIIRDMSWKDPRCGDELLSRYETTERVSRRSLHQKSVGSGHEPSFGVRRLATTPVGCIAALRGDAVRNPSGAHEVRSPPKGAEGGLTLPVVPHRIASTTAPAVGVQVFLICRAVLSGLFGAIAIVVLLHFGTLAHQRISRVERASPRPTSEVLSKGAPASASSNSAASLEARSTIEGWFVLRQPPAPVTDNPTTSPIRILRVIPSQ